MPLNTDGDCIDALVEAIYDAALRPVLWPDVLARIVGMLGGSAGVLFSPLDPTGSNGFVASFQLPTDTLSQYAESSFGRNKRDQACRFARAQLGNLSSILVRVADSFLRREPHNLR
jgi:hypothetical protein